MSNEFVTMQNIGRETLLLLEEMLVMPETVNRNYDNDFIGRGQTIQVEKPAVFIADEFGGTINLQDIKERSVSVTMDKIADVSFKVSAKDLALKIEDFRTKYLYSAAQAIAEKVNQDGLALYKDVPYFYGTSGATPDALEDFAEPARVLNENKAPMMPRFAAWNPSATAKFQVLDAIVNAEKSGTTEALRTGAIGDINGFKNYMSQAIKTHTAGTFTAVTTPLVNGTIAAEATTITMDGGSGTETIKAGDIFTIAGQQYTATADATATSGAISVSVSPKVPSEIADDTAVVFADKTAGGHVANLAYHKDAFIFVSRPLELPPGVEGYTTNHKGLALRVVMDYNITTKETTMSVDMLYDYVTAYPELATRVLG